MRTLFQLESASPQRGWGSFTHLILALLLGAVLLTTAGVARAQQPAEEAAPAAAEPAAAAPAAADEAAPVKSESFLAWMIRASGIFGFILLLLSFVMVALIMMNVLQVRRENLLPTAFIEAFEQKIAAKDYQAAYEIARTNESFVARVLAAGLSKLNRGYNEAIEGMQEVGEDESMSMEHKLSYLALISSRRSRILRSRPSRLS